MSQTPILNEQGLTIKDFNSALFRFDRVEKSFYDNCRDAYAVKFQVSKQHAFRIISPFWKIREDGRADRIANPAKEYGLDIKAPPLPPNEEDERKERAKAADISEAEAQELERRAKEEDISRRRRKALCDHLDQLAIEAVGKTATEYDEIRWVSTHMNLPVDRIDAAPSPGAAAYLKTCRVDSDAQRKFWESIYPKAMQLAQQREVADLKSKGADDEDEEEIEKTLQDYAEITAALARDSLSAEPLAGRPYRKTNKTPLQLRGDEEPDTLGPGWDETPDPTETADA